MAAQDGLLNASTTRRLWITFPFILALAALIMWGWSLYQSLVNPYDGIRNWDTGLIQELDTPGPAVGKLQEGDIVVTIDGVPFAEAFPLYRGKAGGDEVQILVRREDKLIPAILVLENPSSDEILQRLMPLLVALVFWIVGAGVLAFGPSDRTSELFFLFCQAASLLLTAGSVSSTGPFWASSLFHILLWLVGPVTVHLHLHFPKTALTPRPQYLFLGILYSLSAAGSLPYLLWRPSVIGASSWNPLYQAATLVFLALNLLVVVGLLAYTYRRDTAGARGKIRIVVLGGVLSALPIVTLTILPEGLFQQPIIPYAYAFLLLGIIPFTYGYAIIRHRLIEIDRHVNRGATFILVYSILGGFYLVLYSVIHRWFPISLDEDPLLNTVLVLVLATVFVPLSQRVQRFVDSIFYGGWYDYRSAVTSIIQGLEQITELDSLGETLSERLVRTLRLKETCIFLRDLDGLYSVIAEAPRSKVGEQAPSAYPILPKSSLTYLLRFGMIEREALRRALLEITITREERQLIDDERLYLWVPIIGHGQVLGLLALGMKYAGDVYSGEDLDILRVVAQHTSPLIENIHLVTRLKRHASDLEKRVVERTEELYAAKERVEAILASVGDGVFVTDLDWNIVTVNAAFEEQSGYPAGEIHGEQIWKFINVQEPRGLLEKIRATLQQGTAWTGELNNQRSDARAYDVELTLSPVRDQNRQIVGYVGSQRDISRQKELERLKDRLIFDVSHELRTPVTNLNLYLELLERGRLEKQATYLAVLKGETNRLIELIESILDLSRLDMWKSKKIELTAVDLNQVAEQVVAAHRPLAESGGLELVFERGSPLPRVLGEPNQLARLITNLLSNAIRYTPAGRVCVRTLEDKNQVLMQFQDTGVGIEQEDLPNIFDRFYRGRHVSESKINGTGLGLAIVKEIIEIHEGRIAVESRVGSGSTFSVWLPFAPEPDVLSPGE